MELKLNITLGQTITVILLMAIAFSGGFLINQPSDFDEDLRDYLENQKVDDFGGELDPQDLNIF